MLKARIELSSNVEEASVCGAPRIVFTFTGKGKIEGKRGIVRGKLTFTPRDISPAETDALGSRLAHQFLEKGDRMKLELHRPARVPEAR
jgi:hypothetical protein